MSEEGQDSRSWTSRFGFWLGIGLFVVTLMIPSIPSPHAGVAPLDGVAKRALAVSLLVACWWITTPIPYAVTSLVPIALFPLVGVLSAHEVSQTYTNDSVHMFLGGFLIALAIEKWGLHRRIALWIILTIGTSPRRLLLGTMLATAIISMWISNTATTMMMLPLALAMIATLYPEYRSNDPTRVKTGNGEGAGTTHWFAMALILGIPYAANVGGIATPIGTAPNILCTGFLETTFPDAPEVTTAEWIAAFGPLSLVFVLCLWLRLCLWPLERTTGSAESTRDLLRGQLFELGPMSTGERRVLALFLLAATLWITRLPVVHWIHRANGGGHHWSAFYEDSTIAIAVAVLLFIVRAPLSPGSSLRVPLMDWETALRIPWGVILLFGGGFAVAEAFRTSGLSTWVGSQFVVLEGFGPWILVAGICLIVTFLTEVTSNAATTTVLLPVVAAAAVTLGVDPRLLVLATTLSASCAFMLPVATPPNAIAFATGVVPMERMVRTGFGMNLLGVLLVTGVLMLWSRWFFGIDIGAAP